MEEGLNNHIKEADHVTMETQPKDGYSDYKIA